MQVSGLSLQNQTPVFHAEFLPFTAKFCVGPLMSTSSWLRDSYQLYHSAAVCRYLHDHGPLLFGQSVQVQPELGVLLGHAVAEGQFLQLLLDAVQPQQASQRCKHLHKS